MRLAFSLNLCSISSSLSVYNVVPSNAPAFELIDSVLYKGRLSIHSADMLIRELGTLYQSGKASTTDTTADGETPLHRVRLFMPLNRSMTITKRRIGDGLAVLLILQPRNVAFNIHFDSGL